MISILAWRVDYRYDAGEVALSNSEGPIALGANDDMVWFARGRVMVCVANSAVGGRNEAMSGVRARYPATRTATRPRDCRQGGHGPLGACEDEQHEHFRGGR